MAWRRMSPSTAASKIDAPRNDSRIMERPGTKIIKTNATYHPGRSGSRSLCNFHRRRGRFVADWERARFAGFDSAALQALIACGPAWPCAPSTRATQRHCRGQPVPRHRRRRRLFNSAGFRQADACSNAPSSADFGTSLAASRRRPSLAPMPPPVQTRSSRLGDCRSDR